MKYKLTEAADRDLDALYLDGLARFGLRQSDRYYDALIETFELLSDNPKMVRERTEIKPPVRAHRYGSHMIIYEIDELTVLILRVRHSREDWVSDPISDQ